MIIYDDEGIGYEAIPMNTFDKIITELDALIDICNTPFEIDGGIDESYRRALNKAKEIIRRHMK